VNCRAPNHLIISRHRSSLQITGDATERSSSPAAAVPELGIQEKAQYLRSEVQCLVRPGLTQAVPSL
ncbi:MAG: hypothetical protein ACREHD_21820, partial [Pirellulales bacterium]